MRTIGSIPVAFVRAGTVTNLALRPWDGPGKGEIPASPRVAAAVEDVVDSGSGRRDATFHKLITPHNIQGFRSPPLSGRPCGGHPGSLPVQTSQARAARGTREGEY